MTKRKAQGRNRTGQAPTLTKRKWRNPTWRRRRLSRTPGHLVRKREAHPLTMSRRKRKVLNFWRL